MDIFITLFYILFCICVVYPPSEFVSAGFTIPQIFDGYLASENVNFIGYHLKRITITCCLHSLLPLGYFFTLWCGGERGLWLQYAAGCAALIPVMFLYHLCSWYENNKKNHPVVRSLIPYVPEGSDWRIIAVDFNREFRSVDKISIPLSATSKFVATPTWLIKVTQYSVNAVKQEDAALVATATDSHDFSTSGEDEVQYVNIEVIPSREDVKKFTFRITTTALRDLQPHLQRAVRVPEHISLLPTLIERFIKVFKQHVEQNPVYYTDQELELCIGCMQNQADVKLNKRCEPVVLEGDQAEQPPCQQCNCRALWCCACMARWWAARAGAAGAWLAARGSCPVCRAVFCLQDVCPARPVTS
ncbi:E3 ubiquitin-protein ligase TM129 [Aricia agestis]|uniref:E3 ubiquitin-protein ligase TM129 n=1 Tax=Aricia agestis TaxID=91739 RepID=UPI001C208FC0|nr:E3 ubiquitin-protein ligase TM129 [Aricia agestis]